MRNAVIYVHGKGGSAAEAEHYAPLFPNSDVIGWDYHAQTPWDAGTEFPALFDAASAGHGSVTLIANSIGAYFSMCALAGSPIERAFFISPIVDMERLISDMLLWAGVTEAELNARLEIPTDFGETLSWEHLCWVRSHPIRWCVPTCVLYADKDHLTRRETIDAFAAETGARLTVMDGGEHWFHTPEQMAFLDDWLRVDFGKF